MDKLELSEVEVDVLLVIEVDTLVLTDEDTLVAVEVLVLALEYVE